MNVEVLLKVADRIEADPDSYSQQTWGVRSACGTAFCIAGHVAVATLPPERLVWQPSMWAKDEFALVEVILDGGRTDTVQNYAQRTLDFDLEVVDEDGCYWGHLFDGDWKPVYGMTAVQALRAVAAGVPLSDVTDFG
jgi:hypothetical protein